MKRIMPPGFAMPAIIMAAMALMAGCQSRPQAAAVPDSTATADARMAEIAGDKTMTADVMHRAHDHGTFDDALALAMQDSALAAEVVAVVKADPRYAALLGTPAPTASSPGSTHSQVRVVSVPRSAASGDVLDKSERALQKANEKIDQAARVKAQAEEARRKAEIILKPR